MTKSTFLISSDTCCDAYKSELKAKEVSYISLCYIHNGVENRDNYDSDKEYQAFYESIKKGALPTTAQINETEAFEFYEGIFKDSKSTELIHISLSSGLSGTYDSCVAAADAIHAAYPDKTVHVIDSKGATQGLHMLIDEAIRMRNEGIDAKSVAEKLRVIVERTHYIVLADDLNHFRRGGRVTAAAAILGSLLHLKPIIHVDTKGKLSVIGKKMGYKKGVRFLFEYVKEYGIDIDSQTLYIAHAACPDYALELKSMVEAEFPKAKFHIGWIGPIVGAHTGTGTMTIVFQGKPRWDKA